jgi:outer membrane biosynthesis protein TonB
MLDLLLVAASIAASIRGPDVAGDRSLWITDGDYPRDALRRGEQAYPGFMIVVGTDGKPKSCQITSPSAYPHFDRKTCALMMARAARYQRSKGRLGVRSRVVNP